MAEPHIPLPRYAGRATRPLALVLVLVLVPTALHRAELDADPQQGLVRVGVGHKDRADTARHPPVLASPSLGGRGDDGEGVPVHAGPLDPRVVRGGDGGVAEDLVDDFGVAHTGYIMPKD